MWGNALASSEVTPTDISFTAADGFRLAGKLYAAEAPKAALLVTGGTGFPARYYARFAALAAARGFTVLTFDYRGIGQSKADDLAGLEMRYPDWGRLDMPAAAEALSRQAAGLPLLHLGHSVGGHFVGFMGNQDKIAAHAFVCVASGYWRGHSWWYQPLVLWFWHVYGPYALKKHGYLKRGGGWAGESLPRGVFADWKRWCQQPDYFLSELEGALKPHHFADVTAPIQSFIYTDDPIANPAAGQVLLAAYPNAPRDMTVMAPKSFGLKRIAHEGPFSRQTLAAAAPILDWLDAQAATLGQAKGAA